MLVVSAGAGTMCKVRSCTSPAGLGEPRIMFGEERPSDLLHKLAQAFFQIGSSVNVYNPYAFSVKCKYFIGYK